MATTWSTLETTAAYMRDGNEDIFPKEEYSDAKLIALYKSTGKDEMKQDLMQALRLDPANTDYLDDVADLQTDYLKRVLAYKQLQLFYFSILQGEGTVANAKYKHYERCYERAKARFELLMVRGSYTVTSTRVKVG